MVAALKAFQQDLCAICKKPLGEKFAADHCHTTGLPRGLLHRKCNSGIGFLGDSLEGVQRAVEYLRNPPAQQLPA